MALVVRSRRNLPDLFGPDGTCAAWTALDFDVNAAIEFARIQYHIHRAYVNDLSIGDPLTTAKLATHLMVDRLATTMSVDPKSLTERINRGAARYRDCAIAFWIGYMMHTIRCGANIERLIYVTNFRIGSGVASITEDTRQLYRARLGDIQTKLTCLDDTPAIMAKLAGVSVSMRNLAARRDPADVMDLSNAWIDDQQTIAAICARGSRAGSAASIELNRISNLSSVLRSMLRSISGAVPIQSADSEV